MSGIQGLNGQIEQIKQACTKDILPQLDGTYNVNDSNETDSHAYLDLASTGDRPYNTRASKRKNNPDNAQTVKIDLADLEIIKPDIRVKNIRYKVPDDKTIDKTK